MIQRGLHLRPQDESIVFTKGDVWFEDGTVILQASLTLFQVHASILSLSSPVFLDLLNSHQITEKSQGLQTPEKPQTLILQDHPSDLAHLLRAIYEHPNSGDPTGTPEPMPVPVLSALLRLGNKYKMADLRDNALARIRADYPASLDKPNNVDLSQRRLQSHIVEKTTLPFEIAMLAKDARVSSSLPYCLYTVIVNFTLEEIFDGVTDEDGRKMTLPFQTQRNCVVGKEKLLAEMAVVQGWLLDNPVHVACLQPTSCTATFRSMSERVFKVPQQPSAAFTPWEEMFPDISTGFLVLCNYCKGKAKQLYNEGRLELWDALPQILGLQTWEDLKREEESEYRPI
ncbi:hypothetical protein BJ165DRAFT_1357117 [Panaeolus papilionaceus]|nr:hypothetical protein BJ165DRAFT_1357117 [Panaeolus papilionaceus]